MTSSVLDRESTSSYWLTVVAQDRGLVPRSSQVYVYIAVDDKNDNIPQPREPAYYSTVLEGAEEGTEVALIEAIDRDDPTTQSISYLITAGNPQGFFNIHPKTGK